MSLATWKHGDANPVSYWTERRSKQRKRVKSLVNLKTSTVMRTNGKWTKWKQRKVSN